MTGLGIIAGNGDLPRLIAEDYSAKGGSALIIDFEGIEVPWASEHNNFTARFEQPEAIFEELRNANCSKVVMAGAMQRPVLDPTKADPTFAAIVPRLMGALSEGDDAALRVVLSMFEGAGFEVIAPHEVLKNLLMEDGCPTIAQPTDYDKSDAERATEILKTTGPLDIGQGTVVAGGLCLGLETLQGTASMLEFVRHSDPDLRPERGLLMKAPKTGQDRKVDLPSIGPDTMDQLASAHLSGIVIEAGGVLVINRDEVIKRADAHGLFLWSRP